MDSDFSTRKHAFSSSVCGKRTQYNTRRFPSISPSKSFSKILTRFNWMLWMLQETIFAKWKWSEHFLRHWTNAPTTLIMLKGCSCSCTLNKRTLCTFVPITIFIDDLTHIPVFDRYYVNSCMLIFQSMKTRHNFRIKQIDSNGTTETLYPIHLFESLIWFWIESPSPSASFSPNNTDTTWARRPHVVVFSIITMILIAPFVASLMLNVLQYLSRQVGDKILVLTNECICFCWWKSNEKSPSSSTNFSSYLYLFSC